MTWLWLVAAVVAGFVIFKFVVKPLFKVVGFVVLALLVWWLLGGNI